MSFSTSHLIQQARNGHVNAIATLLNQSLQAQDFSATVERQKQVLKIVITGETAPPEPAIAARLQRGLLQIRPALTSEAVIYGQQADDIIPQWSETISLASPDPAIPSATSAPATAPAASSTAQENTSRAGRQTTLADWVQTNCPVDELPSQPPPQPQNIFRPFKLLAWEVGVLFCAVAPIIIYLLFTQELSQIARVSPSLMAEMARRHSAAHGTGVTFLKLTPLALLGFVVCIRPLALQEGTVLVTKGQWKTKYSSAVFIHLAVLILMSIINTVIIQSFFPSTPVARGLLFGVIQVWLYGMMLRLPLNQSQGWWWPTCGAVLFMEICTQLPLWFMAPVWDEFIVRAKLFQLFF